MKFEFFSRKPAVMVFHARFRPLEPSQKRFGTPQTPARAILLFVKVSSLAYAF